MSYLRFDKTEMNNLEGSLKREVLRTNRKGAYHCTTVVDCNTRKYHGLLVAPVPELSEDNYVLLSSLDETVVQHDAEFNLGLHKYKGDNFSPKGHKYIREFVTNTVPHTKYRVGGVIISKEKVFSKFENRIMIKYTLESAHSETKLRFRPLLAFRSVRNLTYANGNVQQDYTEIPGGIKTKMYEGFPDLFMQFSKKATFVFDPYWYKDIEYIKELERGLNGHEDLYVPGYFEIPIKKGESIVFSAGTTQAATTKLKKLFEQEVVARTPRSNFFNTLKNAVQQFYYRPNAEDCYILAGYPWFKVRARDLFISLPGSTLAIDDPERFEKIMNTAIPACRAFIETQKQDEIIKELEMPDVLLWAVWAIQHYAKKQGVEKTKELYGDFLSEVMNYIMTSSHPQMKLLINGLLYADGGDKPITWMNSVSNGYPVVPRRGYIVEFNALWYNALCFYKEIIGESVNLSDVDELIAKIDKSFVNVFLNEHGYLFDYVEGNSPNWSVRPNMIFAVSLPYSPLTKMQKRRVLDFVTKELLTPKGLRSLSPKSEGYRPYYVGPMHERDLSYHQGTAWPWLLGAYLEAYIQIFGRSGSAFAERMLISLEEDMSLHCIGTISEIFDGNPPFASRGAISFAMNVAAVLNVVDILKEMND